MAYLSISGLTIPKPFLRTIDIDIIAKKIGPIELLRTIAEYTIAK